MIVRTTQGLITHRAPQMSYRFSQGFPFSFHAILNIVLIYGHFSTTHPSLLIFLIQNFALKATVVYGSRTTQTLRNKEGQFLFSGCHIVIFLLVARRGYILLSCPFFYMVVKVIWIVFKIFKRSTFGILNSDSKSYSGTFGVTRFNERRQG